MARVHLLDRNGKPHAASAGLVRPDPADFGNAGGLQLLPNDAGASRAAIKRIVVRRNARNGAGHDRIVAMPERLDSDDRLQLSAAGIIAGPFAERALFNEIVFVDVAFEGDLRLGGDRQTRHRPANCANGLAEQAAGRFEFVLPIWNFEPCDGEQSRDGRRPPPRSDRVRPRHASAA